MEQNIIKRAGKIIAQNTAHANVPHTESFCVLALIDEDGSPTASTLTAAKSDGIAWVTFCTGLNSNKARRIAKCNRASVCFCSATHNITLVGTIEVLTNPETRHAMWYPGMGSHFNGPDAPGYCVLKFTTERYSLLVDWQEAAGTL